ncbi:ABC-type dipeptide/oligopeptide/nickel transport system, permease component [Roseovarius mucosus DSM 17069]|uniref:ABC-type dipeptide/oligopeptide/nickel transport system, permease component n=1 Tax=Roseovarius mucosus DSM 17069 TaxID=1288298 RepID=A0A0A0HNU6_9RHOB|nr:ABC transporter permease [Roseovarius mucosus]KGM88860.1 ABC-type dipeptide/oligopeptide/nickel transport system, permease component [Roseovarius mucosus DSM 17069]MAN98607.1 ABC transporter permease [Roseovarius sp.]MBD12762.1 ABC transporter permease [Roseovarius sp.]|tara:strand:+ start:3394 stop:4245 length:852 start_codon:yes stop_codon:yes gene_type:complete
MNRTFAILRAMAHRPSGAIGLALVLSHLVLALISPWIVPFDYKEMNALQTLTGPSSEHWLGTDHLGRDVLTRVLLGGREALVITGIATPIALLWGGLLGVYLGLRGGWADDITLRLVDAFLALPGILPLLVLITVFGSGGEVLMPTLAFFFGIPVIRVARAAAHEVVARDFIAAARARGHRPMDIVRRELLPNVTDVLLVEGAMRWSWMLLGFSALSFLGFGVAPPRPDWGLMVSDARVYMSLAPWGVIAPVVALSSLIIGINLTADALAKTLGLDQSRAAVV